MEERGPFEDLGEDGRPLNRILQELGAMLSGFIWLRIWTNRGTVKAAIYPGAPKKAGNFVSS
jgi:hypothetical protein